MHPDIPRSNLAGFAQTTAVLAFLANKNLAVGGGYVVR
jgi:hypothetical protein